MKRNILINIINKNKVLEVVHLTRLWMIRESLFTKISVFIFNTCAVDLTLKSINKQTCSGNSNKQTLKSK